eukprot:6200587-Pleurochrysis_carterae.AAC.2
MSAARRLNRLDVRSEDDGGNETEQGKGAQLRRSACASVGQKGKDMEGAGKEEQPAAKRSGVPRSLAKWGKFRLDRCSEEQVRPRCAR